MLDLLEIGSLVHQTDYEHQWLIHPHDGLGG
jgi:hypothetical protein